MATVTIRIEKHYAAFHNAHRAVNDHLGGLDRIAKYGKTPFKEMKQGWKEVHNVDVPGAVGSWSYITFPDEDEYLMWVLRWNY